MTIAKMAILPTVGFDGAGEDRWGPFTWTGPVHSDGTFNVEKKYPKWTILYWGTVSADKNTLEGSWGYSAGKHKGDFKIVRTLTEEEARANVAGNLASIHSQEEADQVRSIIPTGETVSQGSDAVHGAYHVHLGLTDRDKEGDW